MFSKSVAWSHLMQKEVRISWTVFLQCWTGLKLNLFWREKLQFKLNQLQPIFIAYVLNEVYFHGGVCKNITETFFYMLLPITIWNFWILPQIDRLLSKCNLKGTDFHSNWTPYDLFHSLHIEWGLLTRPRKNYLKFFLHAPSNNKF